MKHVYTTSNQATPVENIFCIGRNYAAHVKELGNRQEAEPVVFLKPLSALHHEGTAITLPSISQDVHYETELVVLIGKGGKNIPRDQALSHIAGYGLGLDLTARDRQSEAKAAGLPWTVAKGFDGAACVSRFIPSRLADPGQIEFTMELNGQLRQVGKTSLMLFDIPFLLGYLSSVFTLSPGDLIFTGTPEGVGPLSPGDSLDLRLGDLLNAHFDVGVSDE